ncbi:MAG TPA: hypothetical protein PKA28_01030 [Methylomusa anaerophila]|uniref:Uncharacterized protein n=1 Tax=Methylomusa anaerophila TaxID=1930071 RepID=A0A348AQ07_9FIRM|nr:hypothetical protein [Methylomusa anaerophila]BBB93155.1 hypothetical protein MAMMFC1_03864 [Methylomusa anaerophila]HML87013.1 hypothetical protein [Methylomusa anaerophila]
MLTGVIFTFTLLLFFVFLIIYKKDVFIKMLSIDLTNPTTQLQQQLESTADTIIKQLEDKIVHLEFLLEEAQTKSNLLNEQLKQAEYILLAMKSREIKDREEEENNTEYLDCCSQIDETNGKNSIQISAVPDTLAINEYLKHSNKDLANNDRQRLVLSMSAQGYNVTEIAKATGMAKGEIMLFLQLGKK